MPGTVTWPRLRELAAFRTENGCAISLYLNLDPSEVPTPGDAQSRMNALLTEAAKTDRSDLTHDAVHENACRPPRHNVRHRGDIVLG